MVDEKDLAIIEVLKHNSNFSTQQISKKTNIPITTVHNHIKKLEKGGVIEGYTVKLNNKKIGKPIAAYIMITVDYKLLQQLKISQYDLARKLRANPAAEDATMVTGAVDIIIKVRFKDIDELNQFVTIELRNIKGVEKTQTAVILNEP